MKFPLAAVTLTLTTLLIANATISPHHDANAREGFFSRHPKLRRVMKGAGVGIVTGGIGGIILSGSAMSGAVAGAGRGAAFSAAKEKFRKKKTHRDSSSN